MRFFSGNERKKKICSENFPHESREIFMALLSDSFAFSVSYGNKRAGVECVPDQFMDFFRIISFIHEIEVRMSDPVALFSRVFQREGCRGPDVGRFSGR